MAIPSGTIVLFSGLLLDIPAGWHLCDGGAGTPDLRDRFVPCAGSDYAVGATGGSALNTFGGHKHAAGTLETDVADAAHSHFVRASTNNYTSGTVMHGGVLAFPGVTDVTHRHGWARTSAAEPAPLHTHLWDGETAAGSAYLGDNRPWFIALAFIMKL